MPRSVVLRSSRDADGSRHLGASMRGDALLIEGQDLGDGVERILGDREYEWAWTVEGADVPAAVAALGGAPDADPLDVVEAWSSANPEADPGQRVKDAGVPIAFWSRLGD